MPSNSSPPSYVTIGDSDESIAHAKTDHLSVSTQKSWWVQLKLRAKRLWCDTWFLEITALVISITCSVGIYATLGSLDQKPLPSMPKTLTLNTIAAFLGTIAKSSLALMVSSCIGQLKWKWYQRTHKVQDARLFDDASRGPLGSFQILLEHRGRSIACLGALILILSLLFGPMVQQSVVYPSVTVSHPSSSARVNQSRIFLAGLDGKNDSSTTTQEVLYEAIWSGSTWLRDFEPVPDCPSSDCTWDTFASLGLCTSCGPSNPPPQLDCNFGRGYSVNFSPTTSTWSTLESCTIKFRDGQVYKKFDIHFQGLDFDNCEIRGPDYGLFPIDTVSVLSDGDISTTQQFASFDYLSLYLQAQNDIIQGVKNPLLALTDVRFNLTATSITIQNATECTLHFCLRDYTMTTVNNNPHVHVSNIRNGSVTPDPRDDYNEVFCWIAENETFSIDNQFNIRNGEYVCNQVPTSINSESTTEMCHFTGDYDFDPTHFSFCMQYNFLGGVHNIAQQLVGNVSQYNIMSCPLGNQNHSQCANYVVREEFSNSRGNLSVKDIVLQARLQGLDSLMPKIANSLTLLNLRRHGTVIEGQIREPVIHVHVRWAWLALPLLLQAGGIFLFVHTIIDGKRHKIPIWKSSALALLYHGLEAKEFELEEDDSIEQVSVMELRAAKLRVRLTRGHGHGRTVMAKSEDAPLAADVE